MHYMPPSGDWIYKRTERARAKKKREKDRGRERFCRADGSALAVLLIINALAAGTGRLNFL